MSTEAEKKLLAFKKQLGFIKSMDKVPSKYVAQIEYTDLYVVRPTSIYGSVPQRKKSASFSTRFR